MLTRGDALVLGLEDDLEEARSFGFDVRKLALMLRHGRDLLADLAPGHQQELMRCFVKQVRVYPRKVEMELYGDQRWTAIPNREFDLAKRRGRRSGDGILRRPLG